MATEEEWDFLEKAYQKALNLEKTKTVRMSIKNVSKEEQPVRIKGEEGRRRALIWADKFLDQGNYGNAQQVLVNLADDVYKESGLTEEGKNKMYDAIERRLLKVGKKAIRKIEYPRADFIKSLLYDKETINRYREEGGSLEGRTATPIIFVVGGLLASLFFFSFNFTGNAVSNLGARDGNILGVVFFLVGLMGAFFYSRRKR